MSLFSKLPRELIDTVITSLIFLHNDDPAYQWTQLRFITRYHRTVIEQHFYGFWVPKLSFAVCIGDVDFEDFVHFQSASSRTDELEKEHKDGLPTFVAFEADQGADTLRMRLGDDAEYWVDQVISPESSPPYKHDRGKQIIVRLGEGTMSKGFTKGGVVSDVVIPYARMRTGPDSWLLVFKWRRLFSWLFREEMLARKFRDKLLEDFIPKIEANKSAEERNAAIYMFLRSHYLGRRRLLLAAFRRHVAWESRVRRADSRPHQSLDPHADSFDITPFLNQPPLMVANSLHTCYDSAMTNTSTEQSIVFQMPGWETWSMRQLAQLRLMDEYIVEERKSPKEWYYRDRRLPEEDTKGRKEKSEAALEKYLRGPSIKLNTKMFWEW